jgi:hypothetical protein
MKESVTISFRADNSIDMYEKAIFIDSQPIRTASFSPNGNYIALGTNSNSLKICGLPNLDEDDDEIDKYMDDKEVEGGGGKSEGQVSSNETGLRCRLVRL